MRKSQQHKTDAADDSGPGRPVEVAGLIEAIARGEQANHALRAAGIDRTEAAERILQALRAGQRPAPAGRRRHSQRRGSR